MDEKNSISYDDLILICYAIRELTLNMIDTKLIPEQADICHNVFYLTKAKLIKFLDTEVQKQNVRILNFFFDHRLFKYHDLLRLRKTKGSKRIDGPATIEEWQETTKDLPTQYGKIITNGILSMGKAVEVAMNIRDTATIAELKKLCCDLFEQAEHCLNDSKKVQ